MPTVLYVIGIEVTRACVRLFQMHANFRWHVEANDDLEYAITNHSHRSSA